MFGLETLDVLIGLVTVYLIFGMACTAIVEACLTWLNVRSKNLEAALAEFLHGKLDDKQHFIDAFYQHPLVQMLSKGENGRPSYIPPHIVGQVVESLLTGNGAKTLEDAVKSLPGTHQDNRIKGMLNVLAIQAKDAAAFREAVELHFDALMDRASGWVKRSSHTITLAVSLLLVVGANVDTINLASSLASNPEARTQMLNIAQQHSTAAQELEAKAQAQATAVKADAATLETAKKQSELAVAAVKQAESSIASAGLPLGWSYLPVGDYHSPEFIRWWLSKAVGLLVSMLAVSLGAPFWFTTLQKLMQLRTSISPRDAIKK